MRVRTLVRKAKSCATSQPVIIWTRSRKLSLNVMYHLTHRMMISWSKCRPLNRSCAEVGSVIPAVIAGYRAFQQFAPEPPEGQAGIPYFKYLANCDSLVRGTPGLSLVNSSFAASINARFLEQSCPF